MFFARAVLSVSSRSGCCRRAWARTWTSTTSRRPRRPAAQRSAAPRSSCLCVVKAKKPRETDGGSKERLLALLQYARFSSCASLILRTRRLTRKTRREGEVSIVPSRPPGGYVGDQEPHGLHQDYSPRGRLATAGAAVLAPITFVTNGLSGFLASRLGPERQERCTARYPAVVKPLLA